MASYLEMAFFGPFTFQISSASLKSAAMMARASSCVGSLADIVTGWCCFRCSYSVIVSSLSVINFISGSCSMVELDAVSTCGSFDAVSQQHTVQTKSSTFIHEIVGSKRTGTDRQTDRPYTGATRQTDRWQWKTASLATSLKAAFVQESSSIRDW